MRGELYPELPIWTPISRIVRFSCPRHSAFATFSGRREKETCAKSFHEKAGLNQAGFEVSVEWASMELIRRGRPD